MLTVIIPTLDAEAGLARTLAALVPAAAEGIVREVVVGDGGSRDGTEIVADAAGCGYITTHADWGAQVAAAIAVSRRAPWLMILPPDVTVEGDWFREVASFIERVERTGEAGRMAAVFSPALENFGFRARLREHWLSLRTRLFGSPIEAQGLVISRNHWDRLARTGKMGQYSDITKTIGRARLHMLRGHAVMIEVKGDTQYPA